MKKTITVRVDELLLKSFDKLVEECKDGAKYPCNDPLSLISNRSQLIERAIVVLLNNVMEDRS